MSEKHGFRLKKNQIIGVSVAALLLIGGGSVYAVNSQKKAQAEKIELAEKKEKEDYKKLSLQVDDSVKKAYDTRSAKDIEMAETIIKKLKEQDQKDPKAKMTKLHSFLDLIKKTDQLLTTAEKSKKDSDIKAAQNSINEEKDTYLKKDREAHQKRLDKLKKVIKEQKAKEKSEKEKVQKVEEQKQQDAPGSTKESAINPAQENNVQNEVANETPATNANSQVEQPVQAPTVEQPTEQPNAPSNNGGGYTPAPPVGNGGGTVTPEQPNPTPPTNNGNEGNGNGGSQPTPVPQPQPMPDPEPVQKWMGWWNDGKQLHSAGAFNTREEALAAAEALYDSNGMVGTYGASQT